MEELIYVDRRNSNCNKWDGQTAMFGEEGLHAMWVADMDFKIPQCVQKALHEYVDFGAIGYYRIPDGYYDAFINWEKKHFNFEVKREWLRFAPGVVAAFNWMIQMLTKKGDAVIVMTPVYYPFLQAVTNNERKLITSDLVNENGNYTIDFDDFEKKIVDNDVKAFILCSPHNPVGRVWRKEELKEMLEICHRHHVYVISDEIHQDFVFGDKKQTPSYLMTEHWDEILTITAPSKTFNLAGGQNSFVVIADENRRAKWDSHIKTIAIFIIQLIQKLFFSPCNLPCKMCFFFTHQIFLLEPRDKRLLCHTFFQFSHSNFSRSYSHQDSPCKSSATLL